MATAGVKDVFGKQTVASDTVTADIAEWDAEAAGTICEIHSIHVSARGDANASEFSVQNAGNNFLLQAMPFEPGSPIDIEYEAGAYPKLDGLTLDTPTYGATTTTSYSVTYRII
jgi:hypothetical protein